MNQNKIDKELVSKLQSGKSSVIQQALGEVRSEGNVLIIPFLFDVIATNKGEAIVEEVIKTICDIKDKEAVIPIVESIQRQDYGKHMAEVVSIGWQSTLDFGPYVTVFTSIFTTGDYQTSLEAFTVIEGSIYNADMGKRNECLKILDNSFSKISEEKKPLFHEMRKMVKGSLDLSIDNQKNIS